MTDPFDPIYGTASLRARALRGSAKGNLVAARHRYVMENWGAETLAELVARLSGEAARLLARPPLPMGWHPIEALARIDAELLKGPMGGDLGEMHKSGFEIASYDLSTLFRVLFKVGTPGFGIASKLWTVGYAARAAGWGWISYSVGLV